MPIESITRLLAFTILLAVLKLSTTDQVQHQIPKLTYVLQSLIQNLLQCLKFTSTTMFINLIDLFQFMRLVWR